MTVLIRPVNATKLGIVKFDEKLLAVKRKDNPDESTELQIYSVDPKNPFHSSIDLYAPFGTIADGKIVVSSL